MRSFLSLLCIAILMIGAGYLLPSNAATTDVPITVEISDLQSAAQSPAVTPIHPDSIRLVGAGGGCSNGQCGGGGCGFAIRQPATKEQASAQSADRRRPVANVAKRVRGLFRHRR